MLKQEFEILINHPIQTSILVVAFPVCLVLGPPLFLSLALLVPLMYSAIFLTLRVKEAKEASN